MHGVSTRQLAKAFLTTRLTLGPQMPNRNLAPLDG
jgi:hypothetical protein